MNRRRLYSTARWWLCCCLLTAMPCVAWADDADTPELIENSSSGIDEADYTAALADGTILGFTKSSNGYLALRGIISSATELVLPARYKEGGMLRPLTYVGGPNVENATYDWDEAPRLRSLTLPDQMNNINVPLPPTLRELHLTATGSIASGIDVSQSLIIYVPPRLLASFENQQVHDQNARNLNYRPEGFSPIAMNVTTTAVGQLYAKVNEKLGDSHPWTDIHRLTVTGPLGKADLDSLSRLMEADVIDLTQAKFTKLTGMERCYRLTSLLLPTSATVIGEKALEGCIRLTDISAPGVNTVEAYAFQNCHFLSDIVLPEVDSLGNNALSNLCRLQSVQLPKVRAVGWQALSDNILLSDVNLGDRCQYLYGNALSSNPNLKNIQLPQTLIGIGDGAFRGTGLTSITLPASLRFFHNMALTKWDGVVKIVSQALQPPVYRSLGMSVGNNTLAEVVTEVQVPAVALEAYRQADFWKDFTNITAMSEPLSQVDVYADITVNDVSGFADGTDLRLHSTFDEQRFMDLRFQPSTGHLTVNAPSAWSLGRFTMQETSGYTSATEADGCTTTMIASSPMTASSVSVQLQPIDKQWKFVCLPFDVRVSDISATPGLLMSIKRYSGEERATMSGESWQTLGQYETLRAGEGFIVNGMNKSGLPYVWVNLPAADNDAKNGIFATGDIQLPVQHYASDYAWNAGWNLVGNPYPAYYDSRHIDYAGPITVWARHKNGSGYTAYSPVDDSYVLMPFEAFFVQCPEGTTSITLGKDGRQHMPEAQPMQAPRHAPANMAERQLYNIFLSDGQQTDRARLVVNPQASAGYELQRDASKMIMQGTTAPQLYIIDGGVQYAIDERPLGSGVFALGMRLAADATLSISLQTRGADGQPVLLTDLLTGTVTDLTQQAYTFSAQQGTSDSRFTLTLGEATAIRHNSELITHNSDEVYDLLGRRISSDAQQSKAMRGGIFLEKRGSAVRKVMVK